MKFLVALLFGSLAVTCVLAHRVDVAEDEDQDDEFHHHKPRPTTTSTTTPKPKPNLDDTVLSILRAPKWTFSKGPFGPRNWGKIYPKCRQLNQAPINIQLNKVIPSVLKPLKFKGLDSPLLNVHIQNIFRYGNIDFTKCQNKVTIKGGPLPGKVRYHLSSAYLIVGKNRTSGSQTSFNNKRAPFEIAFVFNSNPNVTLETQDIGSEVILHFLGKIKKAGKKPNSGYIPIAQGFKKIVKAGTQTQTNLKSLRSLFPKKTWELNYFTYTGSSVVPPCTEGRIRVIYQRPIRVSAEQFKAFQGLYNERNKYIWNNYRPQQPNTYVQVFSSVERVPKPTTTTRRPTTTGAANIVEDPYAPLPTKPTTTRPTTIRNVVPTTEEPYYKK